MRQVSYSILICSAEHEEERCTEKSHSMRTCSEELEDEKCTEKSHSMITCAAELEEERPMRIPVVKSHSIGPDGPHSIAP